MALHRPTVDVPIATLVGAWLVLSVVGTPVAAADPELEAIVRVKQLLAARGHVIAPVVVVNQWPGAAPSPEAFAIDGKIYVNARSRILRAAVRSRRYDVVLASLILHEQSHLLGANEREALEAELAWLITERADIGVIKETRRALDDERQKTRPSQRDESFNTSNGTSTPRSA